MIAQRAIHVIKIGEIMVFDIAVEARILLTERVLSVERVIAPMLLRNERNHVGAAGGNTITMVDAYTVLKHAIHYARTVNRTKTAADVDHCCFVSHSHPFIVL